MKSKRILYPFCALLFCSLMAANLSAQVLQTPAERANYQQRGTLYEPMMQFVYDLASRTDLMKVQKLTQTILGRDMVLAILSDPPIAAPSDITDPNKPIVLIVNNVHGGEYAGKEAALALMRDLTLGELKPLLKQVVVLVVPTINPDGAEVYRRTNEQGFDLNRDYIKLESQEVQALVTRVLNVWHPDIHIDTHHGGAVPYTLTYQTCLNPTCDQGLVDLGNNVIIPRIQGALRKEDYDGHVYSGPGRLGDQEGWTPTSCEPRKQHTYSGLSNMVAFLFETPGGSHRLAKNGTELVAIPQAERFRHQIRGQYLAQREVIRYAAEQAGQLKRTVQQARKTAIDLGSNDADNDQVIVEYKQESKGNEEFWRQRRSPQGAGGRGGRGGEAGQPGQAQQAPQFDKVTQPIFTKFTGTRTTTRPWGYFLPPNLANIVPLLLDHEIAVIKTIEPMEVEVEVYYAGELRTREYFQGHYLKEAKVVKKTEKVKLPAGSFFVPSGQPKSNLISYIMEPETDDNLVTWNYLDNYLRIPGEAVSAEDAPPRQGGPREQRIPIYRLMKKAGIKGVLAEDYNEYQRNRFVR